MINLVVLNKRAVGNCYFWLQLIFFILVVTSCKKYLEKKPTQNLAIPSTLSDLQALLDNQEINNSSPGYLEFIADNYYLKATTWNGAPIDERKNYIWAQDAKILNSYEIWKAPYRAIYRANFVLDFLPKIKVSQSEINLSKEINGTALFCRAFMFHQLAQLFCKPYSTSFASDLGIVLRLTPDIEAPVSRASIQQTYDKIITDLKSAADLLPVRTSFSTRPNKGAAYAALARVFIAINNYDSAFTYADKAIALDSTLINFNQYSSLPGFLSNPEILFFSLEAFAPTTLLGSPNANIDTVLYRSYDLNDLRKTIFFDSSSSGIFWKGSYASNMGPNLVFDGITTAEALLIRAECRAKAGSITEAMKDLNKLLSNRWRTGTFTNLNANNVTEALNLIRAERRKELVFRGLRWSDLRRLNIESPSITLRRKIGSDVYSLPPNDLRWVLQIPEVEINISGIPQNPR